MWGRKGGLQYKRTHYTPLSPPIICFLTTKINNNILSGAWDLGHKLQLVLKDSLINGEYADEYKNNIGDMFSMMGDWLKDAEGMKFKEIAEELKHPTLKQRKKQETRWARADLSAQVAFFRNAPTI